MSVADVKRILTGGDTAVTQFFAEKTRRGDPVGTGRAVIGKAFGALKQAARRWVGS